MSILNVNEYSSYGSTDSEVIQRALGEAGEGDTVRIPRMNARTGENEWRIAKTLRLRSGIRVLLDNCFLVMETGTYCNMLSAEDGARDISVTGEGNATLSGGEWNYLSNNMSGRYGMPDVSANALLRFSNVSGLEISGLQFEMPRWACVMLEHVKEAELKNLWFDMIPHVMDLTGINIGCGCENIRMENLTGRSGEDSVLIFADSSGCEVQPGSDIRDIRIRNLCMDSNRRSLIHIRANGGHKVCGIEMDGIVDSSDFFEKKRIRANLEIGSGEAELRPAAPGEISGLHMKNAFSAAQFTVAFDSAVTDSLFENIFTFGDSINIARNTNGGNASAENVTFRRLYYGAGSEPNNSNSFISRYAKDARPILLETVKGEVKVEKLFLQDEEDM